MTYSSFDTPLCILAGEDALANAVLLAKYQWPALFNFASEAFFQSEWFLKKMDGQPYCPRLVTPICASPKVLESAASDPHYLAYPLKDLPLPGAAEGAAGVPICAQVEELAVNFTPITAGDRWSGWQITDGQIYVQARLWVGMLAASPGLPAIQEQPVLLLKFPVELMAIVEGGLTKGSDGKTSLSLSLDNQDLVGLQPDQLTAILMCLTGLAAEHLLPGFLAKVDCPFELVNQDLPNIQNGSLQINFTMPVHIGATIDARPGNQPNPESKNDRLGIYVALDMSRKERP